MWMAPSSLGLPPLRPHGARYIVKTARHLLKNRVPIYTTAADSIINNLISSGLSHQKPFTNKELHSGIVNF